MKSSSNIGLGLSIIFACLFLALVAELYYILWWKKKFIKSEVGNDYNNPAKELFYMFCCRRRSYLRSTVLNPQENCSSIRIRNTHVHNPSSQLHMVPNSTDFVLKPFVEDRKETELMGLQDSSGFSRFLFTIKEETKEDLESEEENVSRSSSLSDLLITLETPYLTPLGSPAFFTSPIAPIKSSNQQEFNPLFESTTHVEFNRIRSSPSPKFKFLQEAEEKLRNKLMEEAQKSMQKKDGSDQPDHDKDNRASMSKFLKDDEDKSSIRIIVDKKNNEKELSQ